MHFKENVIQDYLNLLAQHGGHDTDMISGEQLFKATAPHSEE